MLVGCRPFPGEAEIGKWGVEAERGEGGVGRLGDRVAQEPLVSSMWLESGVGVECTTAAADLSSTIR